MHFDHGKGGPTPEAYITLARKQREGNPEIEIDDQPIVSISEDGAWVAAWLWVDKEATCGPNRSRHERAIRN